MECNTKSVLDNNAKQADSVSIIQERETVGVQCDFSGTEDSNIVLSKSWSDCEDEGDVDKNVQTKRGSKKSKRKAEEQNHPVAKKLKTDSTSETCQTKIVRSNLNSTVTVAADKSAKTEENVPKNTRPGYSEDRFDETSYYFEGGFRKVYPYYFTFTTFTKGRWVGQKLLDVFSREFRAHPAEEYKRRIQDGSLTVNHQKVDVDYKLKHNDLLANIVHRHEVPVTASPIQVIHIDKNIVVINKPASIPVHPCGRYRHNTVIFILGKEFNLKNLHTVHRLDRLTSGVLMFGRSAQKALQLENEIRNRLVSKEYICRVEGDFPYDQIECSEPIEVVSYKIGLCKVSPKGKACLTKFIKVGYNKETNSSVVRCLPKTGRMHQIRVHLQFLGYPIVRDPLYNHTVFGPEKGKGGKIDKSDDKLIQDLMSIHNAENWVGLDCNASVANCAENRSADNGTVVIEGSTSDCTQLSDLPSDVDSTSKSVSVQTNYDEPDPKICRDKLSFEPMCFECKVNFRDPKSQEMIMYLHAWKYKGSNWSYETKMPYWADVDWCE